MIVRFLQVPNNNGDDILSIPNSVGNLVFNTDANFLQFQDNSYSWNSLAYNANVVHITGDETIDGVKTFSDSIMAPGLNLSGLSVSQAVVTDSVGNLASLSYASTNTNNSLVKRDGSGNFSVGTITMQNFTVSFTGTVQPIIKSSTSGSTNAGDLALERGDVTNGYCRIVNRDAGGILRWASGMFPGDSNYRINDQQNSVDILNITAGAGTTSTAAFAGTVSANSLNAGAAQTTAGAYKIGVTGANASPTAGPHIATYTASDQYPLIQAYSSAHNDMAIGLDCYVDTDGITKSSQSLASNCFQIRKSSTALGLYYGNASAGSSVTMTQCGVINGTGTLVYSKTVNLSALTASRALVLDASKNIATMQYASANTASAIVQRDAAGGFAMGVLTLSNTTTPAVPTGGAEIYAEAGAIKGISPSGTITTIAPADPHCPVCDSDFGLEWRNPKYGGTLQICIKCLSKELEGRSYIRWKQK